MKIHQIQSDQEYFRCQEDSILNSTYKQGTYTNQCYSQFKSQTNNIIPQQVKRTCKQLIQNSESFRSAFRSIEEVLLYFPNIESINKKDNEEYFDFIQNLQKMLITLKLQLPITFTELQNSTQIQISQFVRLQDEISYNITSYERIQQPISQKVQQNLQLENEDCMQKLLDLKNHWESRIKEFNFDKLQNALFQVRALLQNIWFFDSEQQNIDLLEIEKKMIDREQKNLISYFHSTLKKLKLEAFNVRSRQKQLKEEENKYNQELENFEKDINKKLEAKLQDKTQQLKLIKESISLMKSKQRQLQIQYQDDIQIQSEKYNNRVEEITNSFYSTASIQEEKSLKQLKEVLQNNFKDQVVILQELYDKQQINIREEIENLSKEYNDLYESDSITKLYEAKVVKKKQIVKEEKENIDKQRKELQQQGDELNEKIEALTLEILYRYNIEQEDSIEDIEIDLEIIKINKILGEKLRKIEIKIEECKRKEEEGILKYREKLNQYGFQNEIHQKKFRQTFNDIFNIIKYSLNLQYDYIHLTEEMLAIVKSFLLVKPNSEFLRENVMVNISEEKFFQYYQQFDQEISLSNKIEAKQRIIMIENKSIFEQIQKLQKQDLYNYTISFLSFDDLIQAYGHDHRTKGKSFIQKNIIPKVIQYDKQIERITNQIQKKENKLEEYQELLSGVQYEVRNNGNINEDKLNEYKELKMQCQDIKNQIDDLQEQQQNLIEDFNQKHLDDKRIVIQISTTLFQAIQSYENYMKKLYTMQPYLQYQQFSQENNNLFSFKNPQLFE